MSRADLARARPGLRASYAKGVVGAAALLAAVGLLAGLVWVVGERPASPPPRAQATRPEVPRYVSLRYDGVNARVNAGAKDRLKWRYRHRGLPLLVIAETRDWRRVCDPEGGIAWVHRWNLTSARTVMNMTSGGAALRRIPEDGASITAYLAPRAIADLDHCEKGWCRVRVNTISGWSREGDLWGTDRSAWCSLAMSSSGVSPGHAAVSQPRQAP